MIPFWLTTITTAPSLAANASGGVFDSILGDYNNNGPPPSLLMRVEGSLTLFWVTTTTTAPSLASNASGGVFYSVLGDYNNNDPSLVSNVSGGVF